MGLNIGVGKYDVTGSCAEIGFMGMSRLSQRGRGIHTRLFSKAYIIEDLTNHRYIKRIYCWTTVKYNLFSSFAVYDVVL